LFPFPGDKGEIHQAANRARGVELLLASKAAEADATNSLTKAVAVRLSP
jgi:hypothetical protein